MAGLLSGQRGVAMGGPPVTGRFLITLEQAVPLSRGAGDQDLEVEIDCVEGKVAQAGWAWLSALPAAEHVVNATGTCANGRLTAQVVVELLPLPPAFAGGTLVAAVELADSDNGWSGQYKAQSQPAPATRAAELWRAAGRKAPVAFPLGLDSAETASASEVHRKAQPIRAVARLRPLPQPTTREGRPRLLLARSELAGLVERTKTPLGADILARLRELTQAGVGGDVGPGEKLPCAGFLAAGWAMLARVDADPNHAAKASEAARGALVEMSRAVAAGEIRGAREMVGLAVAYDLAGEWWEPAFRAEVASALARVAARVVWMGGDQAGAVGVLADNGLLGAWPQIDDRRMACWRSAAALAALAIEGQKGAEALGDASQVVGICRRSLSRFVAAGIGNAGWGTGCTGYDETLELLVPAVRALRIAASPIATDARVHGNEPHFVFGGSACFTTPALRRGGGLSQVGLYALMAGGRPFDEMPGSDGWLPFVCDVTLPQHRPFLRWQWDRGYRPANSFHAAYALLSAPVDVAGIDPAGRLPLTYEDRERGGYILRSGWGDRDFVLTCEAAARSERPAAYRRGHFSLAGLGREWVQRPASPFGLIAHVPQTELNVMRVERSRLSGIGPAFPLFGGKVNRVRVGPDGSGSVSLTGYGFHGPIRGRDEQIEDTIAPYPGLARRTVAIDYSRKSGAEALVVVVEAPTFVADREQMFELSIGDVPAARVTCDNARFAIRPADSTAVMQGVVLYPATAYAVYRPPADGKPGRIAIHRSRPGEGATDTFVRKMEKKIDDMFADLDRDGPKAARSVTPEDDDLGMGTEADVLAALRRLSGEADKLEKQHYAFYAKMYKHTRSFPQHLKTENKYGMPVSRFASDRRVRAQNHWVIVLTVGSQQPQIAPMPIDEENLCTVGQQTVSYEEFLVRFGTAPAKSFIEKGKVEP